MTRALALATLLLAASAARAETLTVSSARLTLELFAELAADLGLVRADTAPGAGGLVALPLDAGGGEGLRFDATGDRFNGFTGGALRVAALRFTGLPTTGRLRLVAGAGAALRIDDDDGVTLLLFEHAHQRLDGATLALDHMDAVATPALFDRLGIAVDTEVVLGGAELRARVDGRAGSTTAAAGRGEAEPFPVCDGRQPNYLVNFNDTADDDIPVDAALTEITRVSCRFCSGEFINIAPSARLGNVGAADLPWFWRLTGPNSLPPAEEQPDAQTSAYDDYRRYGGFIDDGGWIPDYPLQHPYLVWNLYRLADGELTPLGRSAVKHAFNATNEDCPCRQGKIFWSGCGDLYGAVTNSQNTFLGPRDEITAHGAVWRHVGSHFDPDGDLVFSPSPRPPEIPLARYEHLSVAADELTRPGRYFVEAWYVVDRDINLYNSMGYLEIAPQPPSTAGVAAWTFLSEKKNFVHGPFVNAWVDPATDSNSEHNSLLCPRDGAAVPVCGDADRQTEAGHLQLAVRTFDLGDGRYRYRYALFNIDYDARVAAVEIPLSAALAVDDMRVVTPDGDDASGWRVERNGDTVRVVAPDADAALDWGSLLTFGFSADAPPAAAGARLLSVETDAGLTTQTLVPRRGDPPPLPLFQDGFETAPPASR